jgi:hypothetical protein
LNRSPAEETHLNKLVDDIVVLLGDGLEELVVKVDDFLLLGLLLFFLFLLLGWLFLLDCRRLQK